MTRHQKITFRVTADELKLLEAAAAQDERKLSDFIRLTLLRAVRGKPKKR